jgi:HPr kinase/phosphorylase
MSICVQELLGEPLLSLTVAAGAAGLSRRVRTAELNRPSLELTGYFEAFRPERIQVIGKGEVSYIESYRDTPRLAEHLSRILDPEVPCAIVTNGRTPPAQLLERAESVGVPLLTCPHSTSKLYKRLWEYLDSEFAPETSVHGVLMDVHDMGVLLLGDSAVGKSECALELIRRGFHLVADDVVKIKCLNDSQLEGRAADLLPYHMEARGLGIVDVSLMFGAKAIRPAKRITFAITLQDGTRDIECERVGLDGETLSILEVEIPHVIIPLRPGRNVGTLVEVAALNQKMKSMGINTAKRMEQRLREEMDRSGS